MSDKQDQVLSPRERRILLAMFPIGLVLLAIWVAWVAVALATGELGHGVSWATAIIDLLITLSVVASGAYHRRRLGRR